MSSILIVEDEEKLSRFIELELAHEGYEVETVFDGRAGVDAALARDFDLILLDIMLPQLNGLEVLRRVRRVKRTPVILLTARDEVMDKVAGLDAGADDYITKPFAIEELLARIRVALKHGASAGAAGVGAGSDADAAVPAGAVSSVGATACAADAAKQAPGPTPTPASAASVLRAGRVALDSAARQVLVDDQPIELTVREFDVLQALMERPNVVQTRDQLIHAACGWEYVGDTNVIDVYVSHIRAKIDKRFGITLVSAVRGVGYVVRTK